jgi:hypothetical protein
MKYWEIIADNLSEAGRSWGCVSHDAVSTGKRSGLLTLIAVVESASLSTGMKSSRRFWKWNQRFALRWIVLTSK